ncbi:hypothetical protein [Streptomyces sp. NPDC045251]|uniref:hypothetical protein n=1 Tax=unclassified Streptomyces TaxID=2593676 RepID=UPI0033C6BB0C
MTSSCDPEHAPVGDVYAALMMIDSRLKQIRAGSTETAPDQQAMTDQYIASLGPGGVAELLDGACTLIYMFMQWLRAAYTNHDEDVIEHVVPNLVATMRMMPKTFRPEVIPTMSGLAIAAGTGLSPNLWRKQYGEWTEPELAALEATTLLLAEHINRLTEDPDFATRMVADALSRADAD